MKILGKIFLTILAPLLSGLTMGNNGIGMSCREFIKQVWEE